MFDKADIRAAIEAGAISADGAARFEAFLKARNDPDKMLDAENLRFLTNFNDIFLTIGLSILMAGVGFLSGQVFLSMIGGVQSAGAIKLAIVLTPLPVLVAAWALAEYFCGRRRLLLPSMFLSGVICLCAAIAVSALLAPVDAEGVERANFMDVIGNFSFAAFGASALAGLAIFFRFRLPFSLFLVAMSVAGVFYTAVARVGDVQTLLGGVATLTAGLITLAAAIVMDMRDPHRASLTSDNAFWLHFAAAPQIMLGVRGLILGSGFTPAGAADATLMLAVLVAFGLLSLAINRRALIVSGLLTFILSLGVLVRQLGLDGVNGLIITALLVGGMIVLLGGGWRTARRTLLKLVPHQGLAGRIFPPEPA
jgi:hypothetical protein